MARTCPICGKAENAAFEPFCSERCSNVDLGRWLGDGYAIAGEPLEDLPSDGGNAPGGRRDEDPD